MVLMENLHRTLENQLICHSYLIFLSLFLPGQMVYGVMRSVIRVSQILLPD